MAPMIPGLLSPHSAHMCSEGNCQVAVGSGHAALDVCAPAWPIPTWVQLHIVVNRSPQSSQSMRDVLPGAQVA